MLKSVRVSCWGTSDIIIDGTNLTNISFANISSQIKIIDTMKYFQRSLAQIASTMTKKEKQKLKMLTLQFIIRHDYLGLVWKILREDQKEKILEIITGGKGLFPSEKITNINSSDLKPENGISFDKKKFHGYLKQKFVTESDYENSKYLFLTLKIRNLNYMNDLYNAQNVILKSGVKKSCCEKTI